MTSHSFISINEKAATVTYTTHLMVELCRFLQTKRKKKKKKKIPKYQHGSFKLKLNNSIIQMRIKNNNKKKKKKKKNQ